MISWDVTNDIKILRHDFNGFYEKIDLEASLLKIW